MYPPSPHPKTNNWHVITGAPCSGKTAVIERLKQMGYRVVPEAARAYIDSQLRRGARLDAIKANPLAFERRILLKKWAIEDTLPRRQEIFLDRALPDSIAYYRIEGLDPREPIRLSRRIRYRSIFLFDKLPFEKDAVRTEDRQLADRIETLLEACYSNLGYTTIRVPVMPIDQRADFVLRHRAER